MIVEHIVSRVLNNCWRLMRISFLSHLTILPRIMMELMYDEIVRPVQNVSTVCYASYHERGNILASRNWFTFRKYDSVDVVIFV